MERLELVMKLWQISSDLLIENVDFSGIPRQYVERLQEYKEHYQEWGVKALREGKHIESVIDCIKHYIKNIGDNRFQELLKSITPHPKNILTLTYDQLKKAQNDYDVKYHSISKREAERLRKKQDLAGFKTDYTEILVKEPGLEIVKFHKGDNIEEAVKIVTQMSKGTEWCTNGPDAAEHYLKQGPLYLIIIDGIKLLCHIETFQLMNANDQPVELSDNTFRKLYPYIPKIGAFVADTNSEAFEAATSDVPDEKLLSLGKWSAARSENAPDSIIASMFFNSRNYRTVHAEGEAELRRYLMLVPYSKLLRVAAMTPFAGAVPYDNDTPVSSRPYGETVFRDELRRAVNYLSDGTTKTEECLKIANLLGPSAVSDATDFIALRENNDGHRDPVIGLRHVESDLRECDNAIAGASPAISSSTRASTMHHKVKILSAAESDNKLQRIYETAAKYITDVDYMTEFRNVVSRILSIDYTDEEWRVYKMIEKEHKERAARVKADSTPKII